MKNLTRKLGMLMLILVLALCPVLMFTGCEVGTGNNDNGGVTDDANKNDNNKDNNDGDGASAPALTIDVAEEILKSMIITYDKTQPANTLRYVNVPNYEETMIVTFGEGSTYGVGSDYTATQVTRINNTEGELQYVRTEQDGDTGGVSTSAYFIKDDKYYFGGSTAVREWESKSRYYSMMLSEEETCIYVAGGYSIWAMLGFVPASVGEYVPTRVSYSANGNVYTINYTVVETDSDTDSSSGITGTITTNYNISITFDATAHRLTGITMNYIENTTYSANGSYHGETVTSSQTDSEWTTATVTYNYNLTTPFTVPQNIIDAIPADGE